MRTKNKPPSREKYEKNNPTVSFRVNNELYRKLEEARKIGALSYADIIRIGLGMIEPKVKAAEEELNDEYKEGFKDGWDNARVTYSIHYRCCVCGQIMRISSDEEEAAASKDMTENG
jgi:hypothetical protein